MVGQSSYVGLESPNYFSTKNKVSKQDSRSSPKNSKAVQIPRPFSQHNGQNLNSEAHTGHRQSPVKPKSPSATRQKQSNKHQLERQNSSPRPIPNKQPRNSPNPHRSSPSSPCSNRSSPQRSTVSPSRSSPNNFASSRSYQPPTPSSLPKPPVHWTSCQMDLKAGLPEDPTAHLKLLLNVQA